MDLKKDVHSTYWKYVFGTNFDTFSEKCFKICFFVNISIFSICMISSERERKWEWEQETEINKQIAPIGSIPKCQPGLNLDQAEARFQKLNPNLPCVCQGPSCFSHDHFLLVLHWWVKEPERGIESRWRWNQVYTILCLLSAPKMLLLPSYNPAGKSQLWAMVLVSYCHTSHSILNLLDLFRGTE